MAVAVVPHPKKLSLLTVVKFLFLNKHSFAEYTAIYLEIEVKRLHLNCYSVLLLVLEDSCFSSRFLASPSILVARGFSSTTIELAKILS